VAPVLLEALGQPGVLVHLLPSSAAKRYSSDDYSVPSEQEVAVTDVKPIPHGYPRVSPSLAIDGARGAIDF
jgi:hypothetical protein